MKRTFSCAIVPAYAAAGTNAAAAPKNARRDDDSASSAVDVGVVVDGANAAAEANRVTKMVDTFMID